MRSMCLLAIAITAFTLPCRAQFFPKSSLDSNSRVDSRKAQWYSKQLEALREPSLFALAKDREAESYRFLWLRTFHHPVAVRLDRRQDGSWVLVTKVASGAGGYSPGRLVTNTSQGVLTADAQRFLSAVQEVGFWSAPNPIDDQTGTDGSQWIVEAVKAGHYHAVDRWTPKDGPARALGQFLAFDLARLTIPANEIY